MYYFFIFTAAKLFRMHKMLFSLLMSIQFVNILAKVYNVPSLQQANQTAEHVWHSYVFNTGAGNREELHFSSAGLDSNFKPSKNIFMWKSIQITEEVAIVGLGNNFLYFTMFNEGIQLVSQVKELEGSPVSLTLFQKWNVKAQHIKSFAVVAVKVEENNCIIKWYEVLKQSLKLIWNWPFYRKITHLDTIKIGHESKLLIVNYNNKSHSSSADIYSYNISEIVDVWLFEKIILDDIPSSVTVFDNNENVFLTASFPSLGMVHIFRYTKSVCIENSEQKHFIFHQKIYKVGLKSVISFQMGFCWYLAVASNSSSIYHVTENILFQPVDSVNLGSVNSWLVVPVDSYREDVILLGDSSSDVSLITWTGNENLGIVGSFTKLACGNDRICEDKMKNVSLKHSAAFNFNGHQNILMSAENGTSLMFKLFIKLKPVPDQITLKFNEILAMKNSMELDFKNQNNGINQLRDNAMSYSSRVKSVVITAPSKEPNENLKAESQTKNWTEIVLAVDNLKAKIAELDSDIRKFQRDLKSNVSYQNEPKSMKFLPRNIPDGITFYGNVLINDLNLSTINGNNVNEILENSFRKNKISKIHGKKTLKKLIAENVMFEKLGDILTCDVVFSGDLCEEQNKNVINGNIVFESNLNILNDVVLTEPKNKTLKPLQEVTTIKYDTLNFDELEVSEEIKIQGYINGELFILPVHNVQLNILDTVNQARIEVINVKENLKVDFINGKNLSRFLEQVIFKNSHPPRNATIKVNGVFATSALEVKETNAVSLAEKIRKSKVIDHLIEYSMGDDFKRVKQPNLKRVIHVFQNLEIDGVLLSDRINNISWTVLNDTVKKDEQNLTLNGIKKFQTVVKAPNMISVGPVNGRFIENVMTNFSDQVIRRSQTFDNVTFKSLSVEGYWDGISVDHLNFLYRLSIKNNQNCNVTFKGDCTVNELTVTELLNDFSVINNKTNDKFEAKRIKTSSIILHGFLVTNSKINQMNLSQFNILRVSLTSPENIERDLSHYNVSVSGDLNVKTLNLNDVTKVINSEADTSLIEKFLSGDIHRIRKLLVKGLVETSHGINGFNLTRVFEKAISIAVPNAVKGNITFENIVYLNDINVTDSIDGFSLKKLEKDVVLKHSQVFLNGGKNFSTVKVTKNMKARSLNGHLMQEVVTLQGDHNMKGPVYIHGDVIVKGDVTSYSAINNVTVPDLLRTFSTKFNSYIYSGDLDLESERVSIKNLIVDGNVQNVSLKDVISDAIQKQQSFTASGKKSFNGRVTFKGNILVENSIHGLNFSNFHADVVFINEPSKLGGTVKIEEAVLKVLEVGGYFNSTLINKVDTSDWFEESIALDKYDVVNGKKTFENAVALRDVSVNFINNHLPSAMIFLKGKQHIPVIVLFPKIHTVNDLGVYGSVNGLNLIKEYQNSILLYGSQTIDGRVLFRNEFIVNGNLHVDIIKGKRVNDLITLHTDQKIKTPLTFHGLVTAKHNVENLKVINDFSVADWKENSVALNQEQAVRGFWTVKGTVKAKNINGDGTLYGVNLQNISKDVRDGRTMALEIKNETKTEYNSQCHKMQKLSREFFQLPYLFYQFEISQEIETSTVIESVITLKINGEDYLIISFINNCLSSLYKWYKENGIYVHTRQLNIGPVSKWLVTYLNKSTFLVTISLKSSVSCEENLQQSNVWIFGNDDKYGHLSLRKGLVDIIQENETSDEFFSLDDKGDLLRWTLGEKLNITSRFLTNVGQNNYKFIDFRITNGLAVSNGREIQQYNLNGSDVTQSSFLFFNAQMVALSIEGKILTAVILKDKVVIYENLLQDKIFSVIHIYRAGSAVWFNYGPEKQAFLVISSHHKLIEVYEYKGVSGFVKTVTFPMFSFKLQSAVLPSRKKYQVDKFLTVIQKKKLIFLRADMLGDFWETEESFC